MKCTTVIDKSREEEVLIYAHERHSLVERIEAIAAESVQAIIGYCGNSIITLSPTDVICFVVEGGRVFALTDSEKWQLRQRLYEIEADLGSNFVKINQSCIANIKKIDRFEVSIGGALRVVFQNGHRDFVSRRQLKFVKERIGFRL